MFSKIKNIAAVMALTGWMGVANAALIFDFTFGGVGNEVVGEVQVLSDNDIGQQARVVKVISIGGVEVSAFWCTICGYEGYENDWDVADGKIVRAYLFVPMDDLILGPYGYYLGFGRNSEGEGEMIQRLDYQSDISGPVKFTLRTQPTGSAPVPETSSVLLLVLGLAGLSFARYRKLS